jgi:hypothetical protein
VHTRSKRAFGYVSESKVKIKNTNKKKTKKKNNNNKKGRIFVKPSKLLNNFDLPLEVILQMANQVTFMSKSISMEEIGKEMEGK